MQFLNVLFARSTLPKVLLFLAAFVFFSANTVYFIEAEEGIFRAAMRKTYHFDFDTVRPKGPYLNLKSALLVDYDNGEVLFSKNADSPRPIASISKLVAAMILVDQGVDMERTEKITRDDARRSSRSRLNIGYELTLNDLLHAALMNSDNRAARALARATCGTIEDFTAEMNRKCKALGLKQTHFVEPTGLSAENISTAHEVAKIVHYAYDYELIREITSKKTYYVKILNKKNRRVSMANTNLMIHSPYSVLTGKTGFIRAADYCLTTLVRNKKGDRLTLVVLGVPRDRLRFSEARKLADWGFKQLSS